MCRSLAWNSPDITCGLNRLGNQAVCLRLQRAVDLKGFHNPTRQRGIAFLRFESISKNPSLTRRVGIIPCVFAPLISGSLQQRNFKTDAAG